MLSAPRENVLFVPNRNVLLTRSRWESGRRRTFDHDPAGKGPAGGTEEGTQKAHQARAGSAGTGDHGTAGASAIAGPEGARRQGGDSRSAWAALAPQAECSGSGKDRADSVAGGVSRFWADASQRVSGPGAPGADWAGGTAADDDGGRVMAGAWTTGGGGAPMASATELPRRTGAMGHQRSRLVGGAGGEAVPDPHDRRRDQPINGSVRAARLDGGEHAAAVELSGGTRPTGGGLHRQSE